MRGRLVSVSGEMFVLCWCRGVISSEDVMGLSVCIPGFSGGVSPAHLEEIQIFPPCSVQTPSGARESGSPPPRDRRQTAGSEMGRERVDKCCRQECLAVDPEEPESLSLLNVPALSLGHEALWSSHHNDLTSRHLHQSRVPETNTEQRSSSEDEGKNSIKIILFSA